MLVRLGTDSHPMQRVTTIGSARRCRKSNPGAPRPPLHSAVGATLSLTRNAASRCLRETWDKLFHTTATSCLHEVRGPELGPPRHARVDFANVTAPAPLGS